MEEVQAETVGPLVDLVGTLPHELAETVSGEQSQ